MMGTPTYSVNLSPRIGDLAVLSAGSQNVPAGGAIGSYLEKNYTLNFMERGRAAYSGEWGKIELAEGDCFIVPPNRYLLARASDPASFRFVTFGGSAVEAELTRIGFSPALPVFRSADRRETAKWFEMIYFLLHDKKAHYDFIAEAYLRLLLSSLVKRTEQAQQAMRRLTSLTGSEIDHRIRAVVEWMAARFELPLTVRELARKAGYSERYFRKAFHKATGLNPTELLTRIRIDRAKHLLFQPLSIKQIALAVGYRDPLYFSKQFKQRMGYSPSQYRAYAKARLTAEEPL